MVNINPKFKTISEKEPTLEEMQKFVGGYIEVQYLPNNEQIIMNEEGRIQGLQFNPLASKYAGFHILGNAILLKGKGLLT